MSNASVPQRKGLVQDAFKDESVTEPRMSINQFVQSLIREYAKADRYGYELDVCDLPVEAQAEYLSYFITPQIYKCYKRFPGILALSVKNHEKKMQHYIDMNLSDVYQDDLCARGFYLDSDPEHGDQIIRRL